MLEVFVEKKAVTVVKKIEDPIIYFTILYISTQYLLITFHQNIR